MMSKKIFGNESQQLELLNINGNKDKKIVINSIDNANQAKGNQRKSNEVAPKNELASKGDRNNEKLNVIMKGTAIQDLKNETSSVIPPRDKSAIKLQKQIDSQEIVNTMATKPAIISSSNTTKQLVLETRKPHIKKTVSLPKWKQNKQKVNKGNIEDKPEDEVSVDQSLIATDSNVDMLAKPRFESFDKMDKEFNNIIDQMNKNNEVRMKRTSITKDKTYALDRESAPEESSVDNQYYKKDFYEKQPVMNPSQSSSMGETKESIDSLKRCLEETINKTDQNEPKEFAEDCIKSFVKMPVMLSVTNSINRQKDIEKITMATKSECKLKYTQKKAEAAITNIDDFLQIIKDENVQNSDVVNVMPSKVILREKSLVQPICSQCYVSKNSTYPSRSQLPENERSMQVTNKSIPVQSIHHFCTNVAKYQFATKDQIKSFFLHTPAKYGLTTKIEAPSRNLSGNESEATITDNNDEDEQDRLSKIAEQIIVKMLKNESDNNKCFRKLQEIVDQIFNTGHEFNQCLVGDRISMQTDISRHLNISGPPKFFIHPYEVAATLAAQYVSSQEDENMLPKVDVEEASGVVKLSTSDEFENITKKRMLSRRHHSVIQTSQLCNDFLEDDDSLYRYESVIDFRRRQRKYCVGSADCQEFEEVGHDIHRRCTSQPVLIVRRTPDQSFCSDYATVMQETNYLSSNIQSIKLKAKQNNSITHQMKTFLVDKRKLSRSKSFPDISSKKTLRRKQFKSEHDVSDVRFPFEDGTSRMNCDLLTFLKDNYWYKWMDDQYSLSHFDYTEYDSSETLTNSVMWKEKNCVAATDSAQLKILQDEIQQLSTKINDTNSSSGLLGFHLCRRGACYRKIGELANSMIDLNRAIELEPKLLDAYWHRHLLHRIQNEDKKALDDLNYITMQNRNHTNAFRSRAELCIEAGDIDQAITSYSHAVRSDPNNALLYYARAELFEERGDIILALEDFKSAKLLEPSNTKAIEKIGMYHFENGSWMASIGDFTELISRKPKHTKALYLRACAKIKIGNFKGAIADLSTCIHLQPNNYESFYVRGCLLRKVSAAQSLQDFSVSLLLDSSVANVMCYLHRGILYMETERYEQAEKDFEAAIRLDVNLASAHVNLGVIEMVWKKDMKSAIQRFNVAIRRNPTYIRAILCRAEAHEKNNHINAAILDYTRAIHMKPNDTKLIVARGHLLLKEGKHDLASFHIRQCAALNQTKSVSPSQQAAVQTFLKNYEKAIHILETATMSQPHTSLFTLLGKTKMAAMLYKDAIESFNQALNTLKPWNPKDPWPKESAKIFYLIGTCYVELHEQRSALEAFNSALRVHPGYAEASYQRGLVKMKLGSAKGVHDFNQALASDPTFFQAFLARALFYGMQKRFAKAIMNCNEAIKMQRKSVRAFLCRGSIKYNIKAYGLAIKDLTEAIKIDSTCSLAYFNRAVCYQQKKFYFKALKDYGIVLLTDEKLKLKALHNRGLVHFQVGDIENSKSDFASVLKEDSGNAAIHHALGLCYCRTKDFEKAIRSFTQSIRQNPFFFEAYLARANVLQAYDDDSAYFLARRDYVRVLHMNPLCIEARVNLARSLSQQGKFMKSWHLLTRTIEISSANSSALEARAIVNLQMSNTFGAFLDINNAIKNGKTASLLTTRGIINQCLGDVVNAMTDYQQAGKIDPSYSLSYYNAANLYFLHKQYQQAISYYSKVIDWNPRDTCAYLNRGVAKFIIKDKSAVQDFDMAESLNPQWSVTYFNRANYYFSHKMYEMAETDFTKALVLEPNDRLLYKRRGDVRGELGKKDQALQDYRHSICSLTARKGVRKET